MRKNLVIVESPAKSKTIGKYLGKNYIIKASMGHVKDLPKSKLGIDIENNFKPHYIIIPGRRKTLKELQELASKSEKVFLCADPDREGEAICFHLFEIIKEKNPNIYRALFYEITEKAVKEAVAHPKNINMPLVLAQQARRVLDRLAGYLISPFLWKKIKKGLSAGRVQSVALRMICEREKEIASFVQKEYWTISAILSSSSDQRFPAKLTKIDGKKPEIPDKSSADKIAEELKNLPFILFKIEKFEKKRIPPPPFITSALQQEAFRRFGFPVKKTMLIAQKLYEGIEMGEEGFVGLITYMRTDSVRVSPVSSREASQFIKENFSEEYIPCVPNRWKTKKSSQDAHEAIRPTSVYRTPSFVQSFLSRDELKIYTLIWERFLASQMSPAIIDETVFTINAGKYEFTSKGQVVKFPGFLKIYSIEEEEEEEKLTLPDLKEGERLNLHEIIPKQNFTQPPPRYTEGSLVKELELKGIGRPSTYATIISTLQERIYVIKDKGKFIPTELGLFVVDTLVKYFPTIMDYNFTAKMEEELDEISEGKKEWGSVPQNFYSILEKNLKDADKEMASLKGIPTNEICPKCGSSVLLKKGKFGMFYACSSYPNCDYTISLEKKKDKTLSENCPLCGSPLVRKRGKFGSFVACSSYPKCNYIKKNQKRTEIPCPKGCGGFLIERFSKKGKKFYTCSSYPNCNYLSWVKP